MIRLLKAFLFPFATVLAIGAGLAVMGAGLFALFVPAFLLGSLYGDGGAAVGMCVSLGLLSVAMEYAP